MSMIRNASLADLPRILEIYQTAREYMAANGNPTQWAGGYPQQDMLEEDIRESRLYVDETNRIICGVFMFAIGVEPTYAVIQDGCWPNDKPYGVIHRIAGDGVTGGVFGRSVEYCLVKVREMDADLRIDTHHDNHTMQHLIGKKGFKKCGIIHVEDGTPRIAYQYCL